MIHMVVVDHLLWHPILTTLLLVVVLILMRPRLRLQLLLMDALTRVYHHHGRWIHRYAILKKASLLVVFFSVSTDDELDRPTKKKISETLNSRSSVVFIIGNVSRKSCELLRVYIHRLILHEFGQYE